MQKHHIQINNKVFIISFCALAFVLISSISYAYFTATVIGNDTAKGVNANTGTMSLVLDGTTLVGADNLYPGATIQTKFTVKNTGTLPVTYGLTMIDVINNFADKNDLVYSVSSTNNGGIKDETVAPDNSGYIINAIGINPGVTQEYTLTIHFKETADNQNDNQGKTFGGLIQIDNLEDSNYLASKIMATNSLHEKSPTADELVAGAPNAKGISQDGLFALTDDKGMSYYLRGAIDNNYVSFAGLTWKVVRINGDGTIRMILVESTGTSTAFNNTYNAPKYVGYTYDNASACTIASPCISTYNSDTKTFTNNKSVTNSTIKNYLENTWYQKIANYDSYIAQAGYCNDTSVQSTENVIYYPAYNRITTSVDPTLKCPNTTKNYGGYYESKIGLLTADEIFLAGIPYYDTTDKSNYLYYNGSWWSFSPINSTDSSAVVFIIHSIFIHSNNVNNVRVVRPIINLRADIIITGGDGTKTSPYEVSI